MPPPGFVTLLTHAHFPTYLEQTGELVELSNQQLIDCSWPAGNRGCRGGFQDRTLRWVKRNGVALRRDYGPYLAQVSFCYCLGLLQLFKGWQYVNSSQNPNSLTMHKQKSLFMIYQPKLPVDSYLRQIFPLSSVSVSLIYGKTGNEKVQLVLQNFELKSYVAGFTTNQSTCLATNRVVVGCVMLLQKAERLSSFCNNFLQPARTWIVAW